MTRILLVSYKPPCLVQNRKIEAAHYRTWQFLQPLLEDGHEVYLCAGEFGNWDDPAELPAELPGNLHYQAIPFGQRGWRAQLQEAHDRFAPDCVIAVNFSHCLYVTKLRTNKPIWMDIYGEMLTIMQASYYRAQSDRGLHTSIAYMRRVLRTGDLFSACGLPQKHALVGELAMVGRLNRRTFGYEFVQVIPPGATLVNQEEVFGDKKRSWLNQFGIQDTDFVVLWCGGYNTWTDVDTLFHGLELAMSQCPTIHYVSVGANTYQGPDNVYTRFSQMVQASRFRERFHLLGWQPWSDIGKYYLASDVGLNIDALHYETLYGTRTRLAEMIGAGLPIITSSGAELSYFLEERGAARTFSIGDWRQLGQIIVDLAANRDKCMELATRAYSVAKDELSFAQTTTCMRRWAMNPRSAPDKVKLPLRERVRSFEFAARSILRGMIWEVAGVDR